MTPKEKAKELVDKMYNVDFHDDAREISMQYRHAKQCALIAVDEIIESNPTEYNEKFNLNPYHSECMESSIKYWNEVKQEIEKL